MRNIIFYLLLILAWGCVSMKKPSAKVSQLSTAVTKFHPDGARIKILTDKEMKGAFAGMLILNPGAKILEKKNNTDQYLYVIKGEGNIFIEQKPYSVQAGSFIFIPAKTAMSFENGTQEWEALQFYVPPGPESEYDTWKERFIITN